MTKWMPALWFRRARRPHARDRDAAPAGVARDEPAQLFTRLVELAGQLPLADRLRLRDTLVGDVVLDYAAHPIHLVVTSATEAHVRARSCAKEPGTVAWIEEHVRPGTVFLDVGANVGAYALVAAKHAGSKARIFAFEPSYPTFHQLCQNVLRNGCQDCITPVYTPLSRHSGPGPFHFHSLDPGSSLHGFGEAIDYRGQAFAPAASLGTLGLSLDDLVRHAALPAPNVIKLDVDGLEEDILVGARRVLSQPTLRTVLVELNEERDKSCAQAVDLLRAAGLCPTGKHHLRDGLFNYVFVRTEATPPDTVPPVPVPITNHRSGRPTP